MRCHASSVFRRGSAEHARHGTDASLARSCASSAPWLTERRSTHRSLSRARCRCESALRRERSPDADAPTNGAGPPHVQRRRRQYCSAGCEPAARSVRRITTSSRCTAISCSPCNNSAVEWWCRNDSRGVVRRHRILAILGAVVAQQALQRRAIDPGGMRVAPRPQAAKFSMSPPGNGRRSVAWSAGARGNCLNSRSSARPRRRAPS